VTSRSWLVRRKALVLVAAGLTAVAVLLVLPAGAQGPTPWSGTWNIEFSGRDRLSLTQTGSSISGAAADGGTVSGTVVTDPEGDSVVTGTWARVGEPPAGQFRWILSGDGNSFIGSWKLTEDAGYSITRVFNGTRTGTHPARPSRPLTAALSQDRFGYRKTKVLRRFGVWNLRPGTRVAVTATGARAPSIRGVRTAPASGFVDLTRAVRGKRLLGGTDILVRMEYHPPGAPTESHVAEAHYTVNATGHTPQFSSECTTTTPTLEVTGCFLPCPRPPGIRLDYCRGSTRVILFRAVEAHVRVPKRGVRITSLVIRTATPGSSVAVYCSAFITRSGDRQCPYTYRLYPHLPRNRRLRIHGLGSSVFSPGSTVTIHIYRGNYIQQETRLLVKGPRSRGSVRIVRRCRFSDGVERRCPGAPRGR
jgi:hypothetical protein